MHYYYMKKAITLLLVSSAMTLFTAVDAQDCDAQGQDIFYFFSLDGTETGPCDEVVAGVCPSTCKDAVDSFHTTCSMVGATYNFFPYEASIDLFGLSLLKDDDDACKGVLLDKALETADTCQDWFSLNLSAAIFECSGDALECPQFCMDMLDGFYGTCSPESTYAYDGISVYLSDTCSAYQDTKDFTGTDTDDTTSDDLTDDTDFQEDCAEQVLVLLDETETGPCKVVAGVCPSTCKDAVDSFHTTCSEEAYNDNDTFENFSLFSLISLIALRGDDDACKGVFLDKALETADTCQDWATLNLGAALYECSGDSLECPQFCMDMLDGFYRTCNSESTYFSTNENPSINVWEAQLGFFLSDACSAYQDTKDFTGTDTTSDDFTGTDDTTFDDFTDTDDTTSDDNTDTDAQDCDAQVANVLDKTETGPCKVVAGVCPSTCKDAVDSFHTTCSEEAYYDDDTFEAIGEIYLIALRGDDDACKGVLLDKALETADTCLDWAIVLSAALFKCSGDALECPQFCMDMLDGFYGTCNSESIYFSANETVTFNVLEAQVLEAQSGFVFSDTCSAYQITKAFINTDTSSAGASISLFASTAVFVAVASVAISL